MVLSNKPFSSAGAAREYYSHGDYYGSEGKGVWFGEAAKELGFYGGFNAKSDQAFKNILQGILPNGQVLGRKTKEGIQHRPGLDLTFSCPKSFSIQMLLYADKEERAALEKAMMSAVTKTLSYIEKQGYVITRKAYGVKERLNKLAFATFSHTTNRNLEPQAHVHCFLANVAKCQDGKFRSITYDKVFENTKLLGQVFRNELALEVKRLGYKIESKILSDGSSSFELANIHPKLIKAFSTRRQEIVELCKLYGITTKEGRDRIVITSRKAKKSVHLEDLLNTWKTVESNVMKEIEKSGELIHTKSKIVFNHDKPIHRLEDTVIENKVQINEKLGIKQIYHALYDKLPSLLPEFGFVKRGSHYISTTEQKVDGSVGKKGKVYVYENNPGILVDYTRGSKSVWDYIQEKHVLSSNNEVFQYLASMAGFKDAIGKLHTIKSVHTEQNKEREVKQAVEHKTWELVYKFSVEKIKVPNNQVSQYLEQDRGYSKEIINKMGIGYIPSKRDLMEYLVSSGISESQASEVKKALGYIGGTHKMVMPYYDKTGRVIGLAARNIKHTPKSELGKYMYTKGLVRNSTLFNIYEIKPLQEIVIVEGMLDCLHARAQGIKNVVALGGTAFNYKQAELINELGISKITVCMDNDKAGQEASERIVSLIFDKNPEAQIKITTLPKGIKDLDELLKVYGATKAIEVITTAKEKVKLEKAGYKEIGGTLDQEQALNKRLDMVTATSGEKPLEPVEMLESSEGTLRQTSLADGGFAAAKTTLEIANTVNNNVSENDINPELTSKDLAKLCIEDITYYKSVFTQEELVNKIMKYSIGDFSISEIQKEIKEFEKSGELLVTEEGMTTKELLDKEKQILKYAIDGLGQAKPILKERHFNSRCVKFEKREQAKNPNFIMNDQQKKALKYIITSKDNRIAVIGLPGVGKSTVLNAVRDISDRKIINILGLGEKFQGAAPTASAAKTLKESANIDSSTLHRFLAKYQGYIEDRGTKQSLQVMRDQFKKVIIFLDESSLVPTRLMYKLLKLQHKFGFKLVITGDTKQQTSVEAGKPFEQILSVIPSIKLNKIIRQKDEKHREAVIASSEGKIKKTFSIHQCNIKEEGATKALANQAVSLYLQKDLKQRDNTLLISPTRKLRDKINAKIRMELKKEGTLQGKIEEFTALRQKDMSIADYRFAPSFKNGDIIKFNAAYKNDINKGDYYVVIKTNEITNTLILEKEGKQIRYCLKKDVNYENKFEAFQEVKLKLQEGLKIRFTKNNKELGLTNSETAVIEKLDKGSITLKLEDGSFKNIPKPQLKHIDYGYCMTIYSAQGKTFDNTIAAISNNKWLNNQKSWLVTLSRHKSEFTALVQNKEKLKSYLISNKGHELSAMELIAIKPDNKKILQPGIDKDRIKKNLQMQV